MERAYLQSERAVNLIGTYDEIIDELVVMISDPDPWLLPRSE